LQGGLRRFPGLQFNRAADRNIEPPLLLAVRQRDPEGIHQMRVGLRRLRAALAFFKEVLRGGESDGIKSQVKWLTEQLAQDATLTCS
jgi:inorganic triphosphatase YgiF